MPIAIDPNRITDYVLECDRALPRDQQSAFEIKPPTLATSNEAAAKLRAETRPDGTSTEPDGNGFALVLLRRCLVGWKNFKTPDGSDAPFETDRVGCPTDATLARLHASWRGELALAISRLGAERLTEDERKN